MLKGILQSKALTFYGTVKRNMVIPLSVSSISLFYVLLIFFWTKGGLLYGGDNQGFYNVSNFFSAPSINNLVYLFSYILSLGNIYATFYVTLFIFSMLTGMAVFYLSYNLMGSISGDKYAKIFSTVAVMLYLFNPSSVSLTYISFTGDVSATTAFFILFLAYVIKYFIHRIKKMSFKPLDVLIMSVSLGLSFTPFPNNFRIYLIGIMIFVFFAVIAIVLEKSPIMTRILNALCVLFVLLAIPSLILFFTNVDLFLSLHNLITTANAGALNKGYIGFYTGNFNRLNQVIRLTDEWQDPGQFYTHLYNSLGIVSITSYIWPILALLVPLVFSRKRNVWIIAPVEAMMLSIIFYEKGGNPPFGNVWYYIVNHVPFGYQLVPTGMLTTMVLLPLYSAFTSYSLYIIFQMVKGRGRKNSDGNMKATKRFPRAAIAIAIVLIIVALLMTSALPAFNGQAETLEYDSFQPSHAGFFIPESYFEVKDYVSHYRGNIVLIPGSGQNPYFSTSWNIIDYVAFYNLFFAPIDVYTLVQFGGSFYTAEQWSQYYNLTHPILPNGSINPSFEKEATTYNITYLLVDRYELVNESEQNYLNFTISSLGKSNIISQKIFFGGDLILYKLNRTLVSDRVNTLAITERGDINVHFDYRQPFYVQHQYYGDFFYDDTIIYLSSISNRLVN